MSTQGEYLTAIADAIREKEGSTDAIVASDFASRISAIASDTTATASDILSGKTAYTADGEVTGTIATKTSSDLTVSTNTVTAPAGYYASDATGTVATATQATPSISVASSTGVITASATQTAGYVAAGTKSATYSLTTQAAKTVTPSTSSQTAVASGRYTTGAVTVAGDSNLTAANIASGVSIFGVTGSYTGDTDYYTTEISGGGKVKFTFTCSFQPRMVALGITGQRFDPGDVTDNDMALAAIFVLDDDDDVLYSNTFCCYEYGTDGMAVYGRDASDTGCYSYSRSSSGSITIQISTDASSAWATWDAYYQVICMR